MKYQVEEQIPLLDALAKLSPGSSKTTLRSWVKEGRIQVDDRTIKKTDLELSPGQVVYLGEKKKLIDGGLRIIYEDVHFIAIEKPEKMLSVATAFTSGKTAHGYLKIYCRPQKVYVVHRLDQDTSGVMLFARSEEAYLEFKKIFEAHEIERTYIAIVEGAVESSSGSWESYLWEDAHYKVHSSQDPTKGQKAITHYQVIGKGKHLSALKLNLETGKKNQIRVHCRDAGHPILGDKKYGSTGNPLKRVCLHAHYLAFKHPITGKKMQFTSPVPDSFDRLVPFEKVLKAKK